MGDGGIKGCRFLFFLTLFAQIISGAAGNTGCRFIGCVIRNRELSGYRPDSFCKEARACFSWILDLFKFLRSDHRFDERVVEVLKTFHQRRLFIDRVEPGASLFPDLHHIPVGEFLHGFCNGLPGQLDLFGQLGHVKFDPIHGQQELQEPGLAGVAE